MADEPKGVEELIKAAIARGEFDDLPGAGEPLDLNEYFRTPEEVRMGYSILRGEGLCSRRGPAPQRHRSTPGRVEELSGRSETGRDQQVGPRQEACLQPADGAGEARQELSGSEAFDLTARISSRRPRITGTKSSPSSSTLAPIGGSYLTTCSREATYPSAMPRQLYIFPAV